MNDTAWIDSYGYEWVDSDTSIWVGGFTTNIRQIRYDQNYIYVTTTTGLLIKDFSSTTTVAFIVYTNGFTAIWDNGETVYLGTLSSGVKFLNKSDITVSPDTELDLTSYLKSYTGIYLPDSLAISFLHGYDDVLVVCTILGINIIQNKNNIFKSTYLSSTIDMCFLTSNRILYYLDNGIIYKLKTILCDWVSLDTIQYNDIFGDALDITCFCITENTSYVPGYNTLFLGTTNGIYVLDEGTLEFDYYTNISVYGSNSIIALKTSKTANRFSGKLYITTFNPTALITFDLKDKYTYDIYTTAKKGRANVTLIGSNIIASV